MPDTSLEKPKLFMFICLALKKSAVIVRLSLAKKQQVITRSTLTLITRGFSGEAGE
jgi:hypothetical protein